MAKRNFDSHVIIDRLQNKNYARNAYQMNVDGSQIVSNPQTSDATSSRFTTFVSGAQTEYGKGLTDAPPTINLGGIFGIPSASRLTVPSAPGITGVIPGNEQLLVYFYPPMDGGTSITGYEYSLNGSSFIFTRNTVSPMTINGLTNGVTYSVVIRAVNIIGHGPPSEPVEGTPVTVPFNPIITVTPGDRQLTVAFTPPSTGGSPITGYQYSTNGSTFTSAGTIVSPITITGLINGQSYQVVLRAVNAVGNGYPSNIVSATPVTVPSHPIITGISPNNQQLTVYFTLLSDGGSPITSYQYSVDSGPFVSVGLNYPVIITGLTNGTTYSIVIRAINRIGEGTSEPVNGIPATVPDAPIIKGITRGNGQLTVTFTPPSTGGSPITDYQYSVGGSFLSAGSTSPFTITGLTNGQLYSVVIRAVNIVGAGALSNTETGTPATTPSAPTITRIIPGDQQLTVYFAPPFNGGSPITGYQYSVDKGVNFSPLVIPENNQIIITGLINGTVYQVIIRAVNDVGDGSNSNIVTKYPVTVPGAPTIIEIAPISGTLGAINLLVFYTPPTLTGGSPILDYQYSLDNGPFVSAGLNNPITITKLTINTTYQIVIRASNSVGAGAPSIAVLGSTTPTVPFPPTITGIISGNAQLTVAFNPPITDGGSPITDYAYTVDSGINWGYATVSPIVITGLTNGQTYPVLLRAGNLVGYGPNSNIVEGTPATVPSAPTITSITPGTAELSVYFTPPFNGGSTITNYQYSINNGVTFNFPAVESTISPIIISGLTNGTTYQVKIRALNGVIGVGAASNMVTGTPGTPFAPIITGITPGNGQLIVIFTAPTGGPIATSYQCIATPATGLPIIQSGTASPITIINLTNGTTYQVIVRGVNASGNGAPSIAVPGTPGNVPDAPTITVAPGNGQLTVTVTPSFNGGSPITGYRYSVGGAIIPPVTDPPINSPFTITGLTNGTSYSVVAYAVNLIGTGPGSAPVSGTPGTVPNAPVLFGILSGNGQLSVGFCLPVPDGGSPITSYQCTATSAGSSITQSGTTSPVVITGLANNTSYSVVIRAINIIGSSAPSNTVPGTPGLPSAPRISQIIPGNGQLFVTFTPSTSNGGFTITSYQYSIDGQNFVSTFVNPFTITGLTNGTAYPVVIRAVNQTGPGPNSSPVSGTPVTTPSAPTITGITAGVKELSVAFTIPFNGGSAITSYQYSTDGVNYRAGTNYPMTITVTSTGIPLTDGTTYPVIIRAINAIGNGAPSTPMNGTTSIVPPSAPTITVINPDTNEQLIVYFNRPTSTGGSIIGYRYSIDNGKTFPGVVGDIYPINISGLTNYTIYSVIIRAFNSSGDGAISNMVQGAPLGPSAPLITDVVPGNGTLTIDFIKSAFDGGAAILWYNYLAVYTTSSGHIITKNGQIQQPSGNSFIIPDLINGTTYNVEMDAFNSNGIYGPFSNTVIGIPGIPTAPTITGITPGDTTLTVHFTAPAYDGGFPITTYAYTYNSGSSFEYVTAPVSQIIITGLTNSQSYPVVIRASNTVGYGPDSNIVNGTPSTVPSAPTITGITPGNGQLSIAFTLSSTGGSAIIAYHYSTDGGANYRTTQTITSPITITTTSNDTPLINGTPYSVVIEAINSNGNGASSTPVSGTPGVPTAPTITGITPGNGQLSIAFTPPLSDGGSPITGYKYTAFQATGPFIIQSGGTISPFVITGLTNGIPYTVEMQAVNSIGPGAFSIQVSGTPIGTPSAPTITGITPGNGQLSVAFTPPSTGGSAITGYQYSTDNGASFTSGGQNSPITIIVTSTSGVPLTNGTTYPVVIRATNSTGAGASSTPVNGTPSAVPSAPFITGIVPGNGQLIVSYCPPITNGGSAITNYLYSTDNGVRFALTGMNNPFTITGLTNGTTYQIVIRALNSNGGGDYSNMVPGTPA